MVVWLQRVHSRDRRHQDLLNSGERSGAETQTVYAGLLGGAVRFDIQAKIVELMNERMRSIPADGKIRGAESISPLFTVQQFRLADGISGTTLRPVGTQTAGSRDF